VKTRAGEKLKLVLARLKAYGFLLESDQRLPSVCSIVTGEPLRGSWWAHPKAQTIFQVNESLEDHADVLLTKMISGKVTWVHRQLWPELFSIGKSKKNWQMNDLSTAAAMLLDHVTAAEMVRTDQIEWPYLKTKPGDAARELEKKLLIVSAQVHTESGAHAKTLETWEHWAERTSLDSGHVPAEKAMKLLESRLDKLNKEFAGKGRLPWN
jgi:hypothetical protein